MPIICRLIEIAPGVAEQLAADPGALEETVESARVHTGVYRYWHGIEYLLAQSCPEMPAAKWLGLGRALASPAGDVPPSRVVPAAEVAQLAAVLRETEPEALAAYYDPEALDGAAIYPRQWSEWEETFDPLGQLLEHYSFLQGFAQRCSAAGDALLLHFEFEDDGSDS
jgi:hypothetical protein